MITPVVNTAPALFDVQIAAINLLYTEFNTFGKAQILVKSNDKKQEYKYPGVLLEGNNYYPMLPNKDIMPFSFWVLDEPYEITPEVSASGNMTKATCRASLIFWGDLTKVLNYRFRATENMKKYLLDKMTLRNIFRIEQIFEQGDRVMDGFSIREIDNQYLMQPYFALRFTGKLLCRQKC
ncbi:MAG: hypothetical protein ACOYMF_06010 [Bacteroidales bacterium]